MSRTLKVNFSALLMKIKRKIILHFAEQVAAIEGKNTGQRVLSTHCVGHSQLAAHYKYQS